MGSSRCFVKSLISKEENGEPDRIRTCDPVIKSHLLYQLSYGPTQKGNTTHVVFARNLAIRHYRVNGYFAENE